MYCVPETQSPLPAWLVCRSRLRFCLRMEASTSLLCASPNPSLEISFSCLYETLSSGREKILQDASLTYQQLKNGRDNLSSWLEQLPHHQVQPSDGPSQIAYKLQAQKVRGWGYGRGHYLSQDLA